MEKLGIANTLKWTAHPVKQLRQNSPSPGKTTAAKLTKPVKQLRQNSPSPQTVNR
jgi:hypothetical protein